MVTLASAWEREGSPSLVWRPSEMQVCLPPAEVWLGSLPVVLKYPLESHCLIFLLSNSPTAFRFCSLCSACKQSMLFACWSVAITPLQA